jgi:hypothetical protein
VIWFACIWSIWKARNGKFFQNKEIYVDRLIEEVKVASWNWLHFKTNILNYNITLWCLNPIACLGNVST